MTRLLSLFVLLLMLSLALSAEQINVGEYQNDIRLVRSTPDQMVLEMTLGHFNRESTRINGETWYHLNLKKEGLTLETGLPQVPVLARSLIIPNTAKMAAEVIGSEYVDLQMRIAPSKGNLTRNINPEDVPYTFDPFYQGTAAYPTQNTYLTEPFVIRDYRGITVRFQPFEYHPATGTLRVFTKLQIAVRNVGFDSTNSLNVPKNAYSSEFAGIYENMFLNFNEAKYPLLSEVGRIMVIKHSMFDATIQPYVDWKRQNGYTVDVVDVSVAGPTAAQILAYIQAQYNLNNGLMFVQIMGDAPQVPTLSSGGGGSDPSFALLAGGDSYPDIYVGRFSAQTVADMQTQVLRTVHYERDLISGNNHVQKGMGIASNEGGGSQGDMGESDQAHIELIRTDLLNYGYLSVDQLYQAQGATAAQVSTNLNRGRGFVNYCGHGSDTSWSTTGFNNANVNALTNSNMLPFIVSVACVNGNFVSQTCFAEAWLRATDNTTGEPTGAIAMYASTINQGWNPPMRGQDEVTDLLIAETRKTIGGLFFNGSSKMIEIYGTSGISEYKCWTIFGDASLMVRTKNPQAMTVNHSPILLLGINNYQVDAVSGARITLSANGTIYGFAVADAGGTAILNLTNPPTQPMYLTLTVTAFNKITYIGIVQVLPSTGPYIIVDQMVVTDGNNNIAEYGELITVNFTMNNVGSDAAQNVNVTLSGTSQFINLINATEAIPSIPANGSGGTVYGFSIQVANDVPDQHTVPLTITITDSSPATYQYTRNLILNAPAFTWGTLQINDISGNNNGRIDAGETVTLTFPITNSGNALAIDLMGALLIMTVNHVAEPIQTSFTTLPANGTAQMIYTVTFSSQIPVGTVVNMTAMLFTGQYSSMQNFAVTLGMVMENFESGFTGYPWTFTGGNWTIAAGSYNGSNAAKSATITHSQTTAMQVTMNVPAAGNISFWKKVSSEQSYDYLRFYINGVLKNQWSGTNDNWSQITYPVNPGNNLFKWEYLKDGLVSSGQDCAWIDDIVFPAVGGTSGTPAISLDFDTVNFNQVFLGETATIPITINNVGDAVLIGTIQTEAPFSLWQGNSTPNPIINIVVPVQSYLQINVNFSPTVAMEYIGTLQINTDDPVNPQFIIQLLGSGQIVSTEDPIAPAITILKGNYPNPFNPETTIAFSIKESAPVSIEIYNVKGQLIKTLVSEIKAAGNHSVIWKGKDENNRSVSSGIYFYKMRSGKYSDTKKMILMK
ncbi:MAG: C25 family cysteine peptidase [Candidatus Cloacimonadaceae bacterium]|nr:C25 family cysteine peptidase [Candidatus Cloacimonadaceae bacterium]